MQEGLHVLASFFHCSSFIYIQWAHSLCLLALRFKQLCLDPVGSIVAGTIKELPTEFSLGQVGTKGAVKRVTSALKHKACRLLDTTDDVGMYVSVHVIHPPHVPIGNLSEILLILSPLSLALFYKPHFAHVQTGQTAGQQYA